MIVCKHCSTKNGIESRFCKSCGLELSDTDRDQAKAELDKLVADGYGLLGQNRTEEAALVAESVLEDNPNVAEALSLLGMCHERNLDNLAALGCYERVVELRPDSALDKIKVQQLRNVIARGAKEQPRPNRVVALAGAAAAVILVGSLGGIVATIVTRPAQASRIETADPITPGTFTKNELNAPKTNVEKPAADVQAPETIPTQGSVRQGSNAGAFNRHLPSGTQATNTLPEANGGGGTTQIGRPDEGNAPVRPDLEIVPDGTAATKPDPNEPDAVNRGTDPNGITRTGDITPPEDPNKGIEIKVHRGAPNNSGTQPVGEGGLTTLLKAAQDQFLLGKYSSAANYYERALSAGGDPGRLNQRLGQCYERMGRKNDAIHAYTRAESALKSGGSKAALEAVRQALQNLRGN